MSNAVDQHALRPLVAGRSAWIGADLAKRPDEWTYRLSPHEIAEIETATAGVLAPRYRDDRAGRLPAAGTRPHPGSTAR